MRECTDIHESQFGFMPGRSTTDAIFILKQTIEQYREGQTDICVTFIDLEKAYDRVPREEIWRTSRERLVPEQIIACRCLPGGVTICGPKERRNVHNDISETFQTHNNENI